MMTARSFLLFPVCLLLATNPLAAQDRPDYGDITKPEFFPILPWNYYAAKKMSDRGTTGLAGVGQAHFNFAPFVFPQELDLCRELGLSAIVGPADGSTLKDLRGANYSAREVERRVRKMIDDAGSNPAVKGYFVMDEPGVRDFPLLARAVATIKEHAPGKLAYINLFPDYATIGAPDRSQLGTGSYTEYLERFVDEVKPQMLSYDNYMVQISQDMKDPAKAASYYRNLIEVRRVALKYDLPYLNIACGNQIRPYTTIPSPANLAFQAYTTLAAGYRGIGWFTYYEDGYDYAPIGKTGRRSVTWHYLQEINRQVATLAPVMSRLRSTGVFFTEPAPVAGLPALPGAVVAALTGSEPMMLGEFENPAGETYLMVVNLSLERSAKFTLRTREPDSPVQIVSSADGSLSPYDPDAGLWLVAGSGALLKVGRHLPET
jgi:hypothetical protein